MVVSPKHRFVFIQNAFTASTAVGQELVENYGGEYIIYKHASYRHFAEWAQGNAKDYFVFSTIRHPLDIAVTMYHKKKSNHNDSYSNMSHMWYNGGWITKRKLDQYRFIHDTDATFADFVKRYYRLPYCNRLIPFIGSMDAVMRFESLQSDFTSILYLLGIEQKRPLPVRNVTQRDRTSFVPYYTDELRSLAVRVFGPQMAVWGYEFPTEWHVPPVSWNQRAAFIATYLATSAYFRVAPFRPKAALRKTFMDVVTSYQAAQSTSP